MSKLKSVVLFSLLAFLAVLLIGKAPGYAVESAPAMSATDTGLDAEITWYGQSFFVVKGNKGQRIAFDPYHIQDGVRYSPPAVSADVVFISHDHFDHNNPGLIRGRPEVIRPLARGTRSGRVRAGSSEIAYKSVFTYHDAARGRERGGNTVNVVTIDDVRIAHLGDLGATLTPEQVREIGPVDVLLVPVGGTFTIDAAEANRVVEQLKPKVVIPMHYKTPKVDLPLAGVEEFLKGKKNVIRTGELYSFSEKSLPRRTTIVVLKYKG